MVPELLNYKISFLNPALKILVPLIFLAGSIYFFSIRNKYLGEIGRVVGRLAIAGIIGFLANFFRYGADIWFVDYKWGESLGYLFFALANVWAVWPLLKFGRDTRLDQPADKK
jgi:hypothetical protein